MDGIDIRVSTDLGVAHHNHDMNNFDVKSNLKVTRSILGPQAGGLERWVN